MMTGLAAVRQDLGVSTPCILQRVGEDRQAVERPVLPNPRGEFGHRSVAPGQPLRARSRLPRRERYQVTEDCRLMGPLTHEGIVEGAERPPLLLRVSELVLDLVQGGPQCPPPALRQADGN